MIQNQPKKPTIKTTQLNKTQKNQQRTHHKTDQEQTQSNKTPKKQWDKTSGKY